ncbi:helix-turn-helix transcriptional regulator [Cohnella sp. CFH 77786]|uniref:helix-turn-helix domain-containing protein n=1 Tax=Cohnella sp. CFH 77786 TaxID=2662265 RepID=UPI001C6103F8
MDTLGKRIAFLRESKGLKQRQLMEILNFNNLSRFERDEMKPGIDIIIMLAEYFDVSTDWLLTGKERVSGVISHQEELPSPDALVLLAKFQQLTVGNQIKAEGYIEGLLSGQDHPRDRTGTLSRSTNGSEREEAAAKHESA